MCSCSLGCQNHCTCPCHDIAPRSMRTIAELITCDSCEGQGTIPTVIVRGEVSADGTSGGQYAYRSFATCGRCRGRGEIEVAA